MAIRTQWIGRAWLAMVGLALSGGLLAPAAYAAAPIDGDWITQTGNSLVSIAACGPNRCGRIKKQIHAPGGTIDKNNPDPKLRGRPLVGVALLYNLVDAGDTWKGKVYLPDSGKSYNVSVWRGADGKLNLKGCVMLFCQSQQWTPAR